MLSLGCRVRAVARAHEAVGTYAEGEYVAFVPWETLKPYLTTEGTRIFGGAPPKGYADEPQ